MLPLAGATSALPGPEHAPAPHPAPAGARPASPLLRLAAEDLKGPLAAIRLHLAQLDPDIPRTAQQRRKAYRAVERNVARLDVLLDDAVDLSRLEHGSLVLDRGAFDLAAVVGHVVAAFHPFVADAGIRLQADLRGTAIVHADEHRVAQAVASILHTAIQATPRGGSILVRTSATAERGCVEVEDNGRGMTGDQIRNIGDLEALDRRPGLGLHFARIMVGLHSGSLQVESAGIGQGTHVRACFPALRPLARTS